MSSNMMNGEMADEFILVSLEKSEAPDGVGGDDWYRYVIERGNSQIIGNMCGTLQKVKTKVSEFVENLNERVASPKGRSLWSPTRTQQKQPPVKVQS